MARGAAGFAPLLVFALLAAHGSSGAAVPAHDGWVTDLGGFLTPGQEATLEELMESYKRGSGHEVALLTVPDLGGRSLERFSLEVAREWGIGREDLHDGALLLVAREERKIRIEVGRGLEGSLTDSISGRIIRDVIAPELRQGRTYEGLRAGIEAMHAAAGGDYSRVPEERSGSRGTAAGEIALVIYVIIFAIVIIRRRGAGGIVDLLLLGGLMSGRGGGRSGGGGSSGGGFGGFGGGGGFSGGGASGGW